MASTMAGRGADAAAQDINDRDARGANTGHGAFALPAWHKRARTGYRQYVSSRRAWSRMGCPSGRLYAASCCERDAVRLEFNARRGSGNAGRASVAQKPILEVIEAWSNIARSLRGLHAETAVCVS